jgi:hypothetical protein
MSSERDLNEYLFFEFGFDLKEDESRISESWPFELRKIAELQDGPLFEFDDNEPFFAFVGGGFNFLPKAGMDITALRLQIAGCRWIGSRDPVGLDVSMPGDPSVPSGLERRRALEILGQELVLGQDGEILEGLFLRAERRYLWPVSSRRQWTGRPQQTCHRLTRPPTAGCQTDAPNGIDRSPGLRHLHGELNTSGSSAGPEAVSDRLCRVFRCHACGRVVSANTSPIRRVVETRERQYPPRPKANRFKKDGRERQSDDPGGSGRELVREILLCSSCAAKLVAEGEMQSRLRGPPFVAIAA